MANGQMEGCEISKYGSIQNRCIATRSKAKKRLPQEQVADMAVHISQY
jgi:hypothetical protein